MIYLFIFIYLLFLSIHYDILENKKYKWTHFKIVITLLILVAGLRWRVGSDTVLYAQEFYQCHDLFHLKGSDFESIGRMPLWVLLNATCKTIWNNFTLVQLVVATFTLSVSAYFIKKVCPSLCFFVLMCYFVGAKYTLMQMELMRESMAVSFYLLGLLAVNGKCMKLAVLYALLAILSHVFAFGAILIFFICYYLLPKHHILYLTICIILLLLTLFKNDFLTSFIGNNIGLYIANEDLASTILIYAEGDAHGNVKKSIINYLWLIIQFCVYLFMLYRIKKIYYRYLYINQDIYNTIIFISVMLLCAKYSFSIFYRVGENYNYFFMCFLSVLFAKGIFIDKIRIKYRVVVFVILLSIPLFLSLRHFYHREYLLDNRWYSRYYPYSSIFDKTFDIKREKLHQIRGGGYSTQYDY